MDKKRRRVGTVNESYERDGAGELEMSLERGSMKRREEEDDTIPSDHEGDGSRKKQKKKYQEEKKGKGKEKEIETTRSSCTETWLDPLSENESDFGQTSIPKEWDFQFKR